MGEMESFFLVDVFGTEPFSGNPLAVVLGGGFTTEQMQNITRWLNQGETTFVFPAANPAADYRVRIFTLEREMPFAGHPTLGSCHAWLAAGGNARSKTEIIQECGVGLVTIRNFGRQLAFAAPPLIRSGPVGEEKLEELCSSFLGINRNEVVDAAWADNGPGWLVLQLGSARRVLDLTPKRSYPTRLDVGVVGQYPTGNPEAFELRAFFTDHLGQVREDAVTGSLNASVAQWLFSTGRASGHYVARQGSALGRHGQIDLTQDATGQVWVGGKTATMFSGRLAESSRCSGLSL